MSFLASLGLHTRQARAWAMYDWANSAFITTIGAVILPIYYSDVAASNLDVSVRTAYWGYTAGFSLLVVAIIAPVLGAASDYLGAKKLLLGGFVALGCLSSIGLYFVGQGDWLLASILFIAGHVAFAAGNVFYDGLLPHVAKARDLDRVSAAGYALGYMGGGLLLIINCAWILMPDTFGFADAAQASRASFASVGIWWAVFSVPLFRRVPEPQSGQARLPGNLVAIAFGQVFRTLRQITKFRNAFLFLVAFWLYNDGINTIIKMATIYGREIGIERGQLIGAMILVQIVGIPCTFLFGPLAGRWGQKKSIYGCLVVYCAISVFGFFMSAGWHFWVLAFAVAMVQGGSQALSRSLFASMIPRHQSSEFFAFFTVSGKFAGVFGPLLFGLSSQIMGESRFSILLLIAFFVGGMLLLAMVDPIAGKAEARTAESNAALPIG